MAMVFLIQRIIVPTNVTASSMIQIMMVMGMFATRTPVVLFRQIAADAAHHNVVR
jgi:hypothetical protein